MFIGYKFFIFRVFHKFQNSGLQNQGLHNHFFEQGVEIITTANGELLHERVWIVH
jgi:hypothetical protein